MTNQNESLNLIREKQELDIFLSNIAEVQLPHKDMGKKTITAMEIEEILPVSDQNKSFNLVREKQELDIFFTRITASRLPDEIIQEKPAVTVGMGEQLPLPNRVPAYTESERLDKSEKESVSIKVEEERIVSVAIADEEGKISIDPIKDIKPAKDSLAVKGSTTEEQFQTLAVKKTLDLSAVQQEPIQKSDSSDVLLSDKNSKTDQTAALKIAEQSEDAPAPLGDSMDEIQKMQADEPLKDEGKQISKGKRLRLIAFLIVFMFFTVMIQGYLWLYPNAGHEIVQWMCSEFLVIEQLLGVEKGKVDIVTNQIEFIDVKQRFVSNEPLGNMRIIEGVVANQADVPISKIRVMGELLGSRGELLTARVSFCGNIIPDEILGRLDAEQISYISSVLQSENISNNRIAPKGQIPFMIVFIREPAGVEKATVTAVGAEKIVP
jgi:hypothetical protein